MKTSIPYAAAAAALAAALAACSGGRPDPYPQYVAEIHAAGLVAASRANVAENVILLCQDTPAAIRQEAATAEAAGETGAEVKTQSRITVKIWCPSRALLVARAVSR